MSEQNKAIVGRMIDDLWNQGRLEVIDEVYAEDYADRSPGLPPGSSGDRDGQKQFVQAFRAAFPDIVGEVEDEIAEGDRVVQRWSVQATHQGDFMGIPATRKSVNVQVIDIVRVSDGKLAEHWGIMDAAAMMQQLGVAPPG